MKPKLHMQQEIMSLDIGCVNYVPIATATSKGYVLCVLWLIVQGCRCPGCKGNWTVQMHSGS